jgi:hypothetical protein
VQGWTTLQSMRVQQTALFRAVVIAGAALTGCARNEGNQPPKPAPAPPLAPSATAPDQPSVAAPTAIEPSVAPSATEPGVDPAPSATPDAGVAKKPCPPGSEAPFPPCYYIL